MQFKSLKNIELKVYSFVYSHKEISRSEVGALVSSLSNSSLYRMLDKLVKKGYLYESFGPVKTNGRPPKIYRINPQFSYAIGVYITWDSIGLALVDIGGNVIVRRTIGSSKTLGPNEALEMISISINDLVEEYNCSDTLLGIGISAFGPIMKKPGILSHGYHKPSLLWDYVPVKDLVETSTRYPVVVDNLVDAFLLDELILRPYLMDKCVAYFLLDEGIGSAFHPPFTHSTNTDTSSQLGHMVIDLHGDTCICGKKGCLETFASAQELLKRLSHSCVENISEGGIVFDKIEALVKSQMFDFDCSESSEIALALATGMINYIQVTEPEVVLIGGRTVDLLGPIIQETIQLIEATQRLQKLTQKLEINCVEISNDSLARGAASLVFRKEIGLSPRRVKL